MILHILECFFYLIDAVFGAFFRNVIVNVEDHFFVCVAHPDHGLFHIDTRITEHGAIGMPEIMRTDANGMSCGV